MRPSLKAAFPIARGLVTVALADQPGELPDNVRSLGAGRPEVHLATFLESIADSEHPPIDTLLLDCRGSRPKSLLRVANRIRRAGWSGFTLFLLEEQHLVFWSTVEAQGRSDFVTPRTPSCEVEARLRADRQRQQLPPSLSEGAKRTHVIDWKRLELTAGGVSVRLTLREMQIFDALSQSQAPVDAAILASTLWGPKAMASTAVTHICALRKKLAWFGGSMGIRTVPGQGYLFVVKGFATDKSPR